MIEFDTSALVIRTFQMLICSEMWLSFPRFLTLTQQKIDYGLSRGQTVFNWNIKIGNLTLLSLNLDLGRQIAPPPKGEISGL